MELDMYLNMILNLILFMILKGEDQNGSFSEVIKEEKKRQEGIVDENPLGIFVDEEIKMEEDVEVK